MKHILIIIVLFIYSISVYAWEWNGIKDMMTYENVTNILGKPINTESTTDKSEYSSLEYVNATYSYQGYVLSVTFFRKHEVTEMLGIEIYDSSLPFTVTALTILPGINNLTKSDIHTQLGNPKKVGRHNKLGLREEYSDGAIVDYSPTDDTTVLEIKYGYVK